MSKRIPIPVIDLFAGPGGLGEGFSSYPLDRAPLFRICLSIEKEKWAHATLLLRSFYRLFPRGKVPEEYYRYLRGEIAQDRLFERYPAQFERACQQSQHVEIGPENRHKVRRLIAERVGGCKTWILIGGPPCQAYSVIGRSRVIGEDRRNKTNKYETDARHMLYKEYLRIIADHWPPLFVMENVKGLLSSRLNGDFIFPRMLADLQDPGKALRKRFRDRRRYDVLSFVTESGNAAELKPVDYVIQTEKYGLPQSRHRLILLGVRSDLLPVAFSRLQKESPVPIEYAVSDVPAVRSGLSESEDTPEAWRLAVSDCLKSGWFQRLREDGRRSAVADEIEKALATIAATPMDRGGEFVQCNGKPQYRSDWFCDNRLGGLCNHTTRVHIKADLHRYLFAACYGTVFGKSPVLREYPCALLPEHRNALA